MADKRESFRARLLEMRNRLSQDVNNIEEAVREDTMPTGDVSHARTHMADSNESDVNRNITMAENEAGILDQVRHALDRIDSGTFGRCERCGREIAGPRLDALPYTPYCIDCAQAAER